MLQYEILLIKISSAGKQTYKWRGRTLQVPFARCIQAATRRKSRAKHCTISSFSCYGTCRGNQPRRLLLSCVSVQIIGSLGQPKCATGNRGQNGVCTARPRGKLHASQQAMHRHAHFQAYSFSLQNQGTTPDHRLVVWAVQVKRAGAQELPSKLGQSKTSHARISCCPQDN